MAEAEHRPGDIVNGHMLSADGTTWVPVAQADSAGGAPPPSGASEPEKPKKKHHIFLWFFLAVQALFLIWIIGGVNSVSTTDCGTLSKEACDDATAVGAGIGVAMIITLWIAVDFILAITYGIYRLAKHN